MLRNLIAYWILGLTNNYGYVVMLTAAHDIMHDIVKDGTTEAETETFATDRGCSKVSIGVILLADIIPSLIVKLIAPFLPFYVHIRVMIIMGLTVISLLLVAYAPHISVAILGVAFTSCSAGLGESTFLAYTTVFNKNVVSTWSSGTGGAGVFGSFTYAILTGVGLTPQHSLLIMLVMPALQGLAFWVILRHPKSSESESLLSSPSTLTDVKSKLKYLNNLWIFIIPLALVYFLEYLINQGLAIYFFTPSIWIVFVVIFWEGLLGGAAYVNTFYRMSTVIPAEFQVFAFSITTLADTLGIALAGFAAIPVHEAICSLPLPEKIIIALNGTSFS